MFATLRALAIIVVEASNGFANGIPDFRDDGYLPEGLHIATLAEVTFRFGSTNRQRKRLVLRLRRWVELATAIRAVRLFVDGSVVTAKTVPNDVDAVVWLPNDFRQRLEQDDDAAVELETMLLTRQPQEIFAAEDESDWKDWLEFFTRTREEDGRRKGVVEVRL